MMNPVVKFMLWLDKSVPACGRLKRFAYACRAACTPTRESYSQFREDVVIAEELKDRKASDAIYVDVGANHPSCLSNTYLLYRNGWSGVTIEPNSELVKLHRRFRRRDVQVAVGCGREAALLPFYLSQTPVLSSFSGKDVDHFSRTEYLPILTLDQLLAPFQDKQVALLSIDTEGFDLLVLEGAKETLKRTHLVCIESNTEEERRNVQAALSADFAICATAGCNQIFRRRHE
jgi:FkbM family methyltransferase